MPSLKGPPWYAQTVYEDDGLRVVYNGTLYWAIGQNGVDLHIKASSVYSVLTYWWTVSRWVLVPVSRLKRKEVTHARDPRQRS